MGTIQEERQKRVTQVTLLGAVVNLVLTAAKFVAGIVGHSAAMVSDAVHSLSDLVSDFIVLVFVRISSKEKDKSHDYGHGKFETLAALIISALLVGIAVKLLASGISDILRVVHGETLEAPGMIAFYAAVVSILAKEWTYRFTVKVGRQVDSPAVIANAWHHRTDALSSIGSLLGIGGAIFLGEKWTVLDPVAGCVIAVFIVVAAVEIGKPAVEELLDVSLSDDIENEIIAIADSVEGVHDVHNLKTRKMGSSYIMDAHVVVSPDITVEAGHDIATAVEEALCKRFGEQSQISLHVEPDIDSK